MKFIRSFNRENSIFQATFFKFISLLGNESCQQMQNFSTIFPKLCQLGKKQRDMGCEYHYIATSFWRILENVL